jgi:hypothetical protein
MRFGKSLNGVSDLPQVESVLLFWEKVFSFTANCGAIKIPSVASDSLAITWEHFRNFLSFPSPLRLQPLLCGARLRCDKSSSRLMLDTFPLAHPQLRRKCQSKFNIYMSNRSEQRECGRMMDLCLGCF